MVKIKRKPFDSHPKLPLDPDSDRFRIVSPYHTDGAHITVVAFGAFFGTLARYEIDVWIPMSKNGWPMATMIINVSGAFLLGLLVQALLHRGGDVGYRRILRLTLGTGFLGAFTTYSTLATGVVLLARNGDAALAAWYAGVSVILGIAACALGIRLATTHYKLRAGKA